MNQVEVLLPKPFDHGFDYRVPANMALKVGDYVLVPFGKQTLVGVVWREGTQNLAESKIKEVQEIVEHIPFLSNTHMRYIEWVAAYCFAPRGMVLKMVMPVENAFEDKASRVKLLKETGKPPVVPDLSPFQQQAAQKLVSKLDKGFSVTLLDGITGSGKTEVYFEAIEKVLANKAQGLVLLPEIALSTQWVKRCETRFGIRPHIWHSGLTPAQRRETWRAIAKGEAPLVVGARSALFLPFPNLKLIVVDEEHEASYKQEDGVLYHARDMAVARAHHFRIPIILASATPSLETVYNVQQGKYDCVKLAERHGGAALPSMKLIDMRHEMMEPGNWIAPTLRTRIAATLGNGKQAMLFLNRRGYAPLLLCRGCGYRFACSVCTAWMVVHRNGKKQTLLCHHCGHHADIPEACPDCGAKEKFAACGPGVERVLEEVQQLFPEVRVEMMTSDTTTSLNNTQQLVDAMTAGEINILIGTQMMAKGYHFPSLHLIGVIDADLGLAGGDLRAAERTYQILHQVAGRAGREGDQGEVWLQTYLPEHPVMQALEAHDRKALEELELEAREYGGYPPFGRLAGIIVDGILEAEVQSACRQLARHIPTSDQVRVLGPAPAPLSRLRGRYRQRFLVCSSKNISLQAYLHSWLNQASISSKIRIRVDIDPYSFL